MLFETKECTNPDIVKELFVEYSHIKGAESCFVSFDKELIFTTKPEVMRIGYSLYKRLGYEELSEENGIVSMRIDLSKEYPYG